MENKILKEKRVFICEIIIIVAIIVCGLIFNLVGTTEAPIKGDYVTKKTFDDVNKAGVQIGCLMGTTVYDALRETFKNATIRLYNTNEDVYAAVESGAVDYGVGYIETCEEIVEQFDNIKYFAEPVHITSNSFIFSKTEKGSRLCNEFNDYINKIKETDEYTKLYDKWHTLDPKNYYFENYDLEGTNGDLNVVTCVGWVPMIFYYNEKFVGFFIELVYGFCDEYGYKPNIESANYAAELAGVTSGKYDMMADIAEITKERLEVVNMSIPIHEQKEILYSHEIPTDVKVVPKSSVFIQKISENLNKNFIIDSRWKLFVYGLVITIALAFISAVCGTLLGAMLCFFRMNENPFLVAFAKLYIKIIQGTPIVVLLMIFNYIIFNNKGVSAFGVSIIGFSLDFAAYVSEIFRAGIESVPNGQVKAAYALGFNKIQAFTKVVLPQALIYILPVYSGQFISMVKLTSVAGYISVEDLTKVSDYVRTLTYDAFFPLITTAIIYFLLSTLLVCFLKYVKKKVDPNLRKRSIKGVKECL